MISVLPVDKNALVNARFAARPNRFLVRAELDTGEQVDAFMPNPGRLRELLFPGTRLWLVRLDDSGARKTRFMVIAGERQGRPVLLQTHWNNLVARRLLERRLVPGLEGAEIVRGEMPEGRSRFDFLLRDTEGDLLLEVKSCSLFGNGVAMFPDAVTARGRRHLLELAELSGSGRRCRVLFLVHTPNARWFMPDYHTDLEFSRTLLEVRGRVGILPLALDWSDTLELDETALRPLPIPWQYIEREAHDRGAYLLILTLDRGMEISVGALGAAQFQPGFHVYAGSAMGGLTARINRHLRRRKQFHWHVDYLREHASSASALPVRSSDRRECALADALARIMRPGPEGFGCGDCRCRTHLFYSPDPPEDRPDFQHLLESFRMRTPE